MKLYRILQIALLLTSPIFTNRASSQELPQDPAILKGQLKNGFTYIIRKNTVPKKKLTVYLVIKAGSVLENDNQRGLAHFMEHMSFNGTKHFPANSLVEFLQKAGVRFGADLNAYTSFDETVYQLPIAADDVTLVDQALQVIRDWAQDATLDQAELDKERGVVLEEERMRSGIQSRMSERLMPIIYNRSKYASRLPIGVDSVLKNFDRETILSFYRDWYRPDLEGIIVVGDIDPKGIEQKVKALFDDLKVPAVPKLRPDFQIQLNGARQYAVITDKEMQGSSLQVIYKFPHRKLRTNADYLEYLKRNLFNLVLANRLQSVYQNNAAFYLGAGASVQPILSNVDAFTITVSTKNGLLKPGFQALWREMTKIRDNGFTDVELETAKTFYLSRVQAQADEVDKAPSGQLAGEYTRLFLQGEASPGVLKEAELTTAYLPTISPNHLKQLMKRYLAMPDRDVIASGPESAKDKLPIEAALAGWLDEADASSAPTGIANSGQFDVERKPLIEAISSPGKIVSSKEIKAFDGHELVLSNGLRIIVKPTTFQNNEIAFSAFSPGGTSVTKDADFRSASLAAAIVSQSGIGSFGSETLRLKLTGKIAGVSPFINERFAGLYGATNISDLETALQLTYLYFTSPRKDTTIFQSEIGRLTASLQNKIDVPDNQFADTVNAVLTNNSYRRKPISLDEVKEIDLDKILKFYREQFSDASNFTFVFVGNVNLETAKPLFEKYLGALPTSNSHYNWHDLNIRIPSGKLTKTVKAGDEVKATVSMVISGDYLFSIEENLKLEGIKQMLEIHLIERLREKESGVYSPKVNLDLSKYLKQYAFSISFTCAPSNVDKLIDATWQEIKSIKDLGPTADDLKKFQSEQSSAIESSLETNRFWLSYLTNQYQNQEDITAVQRQRELLKSFNSEVYRDAAQRYLTDRNYIRLVKLPKDR
ncbi:M16 family metallopeptidase [Mucilaginibacter celer]|uniref:Insulinase family protein n=1 Tax=Mucilaginibacter celer TaxID=2305508 RepID=A0A494VHU0_9SPHI|nr:insulinase family protein [Mucilaginibacter celer]AYL94357.1 insulinase family protein [Mucilaginibacter celer]